MAYLFLLTGIVVRNNGDFDEEDKNDVPLLRFDISKKFSKSEYAELQDNSFCTQLTALDDRKLLTKAAQVILKEAEENCSVLSNGLFEYHWKRAMEQLSWMEIKAGKLV